MFLHTLLPLDDHDADRDEIELERAISEAEQRGMELLLKHKQDREKATVGDAETWP